MAELGLDHGHASLMQMNETIRQQEKRIASAAKLPAAVATIKAAVSNFGELKAAAKAERDPSKKADLFSQLSKKLSAELAGEKDLVKATEIRRECMAADKAYAFALLAERSANPGASAARKYLDAAS